MQEQAFYNCVGFLAHDFHRRYPDSPGMGGPLGYPESRKPAHLGPPQPWIALQSRGEYCHAINTCCAIEGK